MFFLVSNPSHSKVFISIIRSFIHLGTTELSNYLGTTHLSVTCKAAPRCSSPRARRRDPMAAAVAAQPTPLCAASENRKQSGPRMREHTVRAQDPGPHDPPPPGAKWDRRNGRPHGAKRRLARRFLWALRKPEWFVCNWCCMCHF